MGDCMYIYVYVCVGVYVYVYVYVYDGLFEITAKNLLKCVDWERWWIWSIPAKDVLFHAQRPVAKTQITPIFSLIYSFLALL